MTAKEEREKRLAAQLRANLRRRKAAPLDVTPEVSPPRERDDSAGS